MRLKTVATLLILACAASLAGAEVTNLTCEQTGPAEYKLAFSFTGDTHQVRIFAGADPSHPASDTPILTTHDTTVTVHVGKPGERVYFFLKPDHGEQREVSIRHLPLQGSPNFRDLGGYETKDGRFTRWGLIYRSGVLSNLTPADFTYLGQLGVRVVCDFRTAGENKSAPEIWIPNAAVEHVSLPIGTDGNQDVNASMQAMLANNPTAEQLRQSLTRTYGEFAFNNAPEYSQVFKQLEQDHLPLLYHCTAGKDRTGVFSALLLLTLGVPEKTVLADYSLTNKYLLDSLSPADTQKMLAGNPLMAKATPEQRKVLMAADPDYLRSTLRMIEAKYGSFDNYRRKALGVSDEQAQLLRSRLLEK